MLNPDEAGRRNLRDFLQMYNRFTEECFTKCIKNLNYRVLTPEEKACTDRCATKLVNINHRLISKYMEINPLNRQLATLEGQQKVADNQERTITQIGGAEPSQNLAAQVKEVFGEGLKLADNSKTTVSSSDSQVLCLADQNAMVSVTKTSLTDSTMVEPQAVQES